MGRIGWAKFCCSDILSHLGQWNRDSCRKMTFEALGELLYTSQESPTVDVNMIECARLHLLCVTGNANSCSLLPFVLKIRLCWSVTPLCTCRSLYKTYRVNTHERVIV